MNDQERCSLCNEELSRYGNKQLADGIMCRNCAKLVSPWYTDDDLKEMTVEALRDHLEYRKQNEEKVAAFKESRKVDGKYSLYIDDEDGLFMLSKRKDLQKDNPDVLALGDIEEIEVSEERYQDTGVDIYLKMKLNGGQIRHLKMRVNEFPGIARESDEYQNDSKLALAYLDALASEDFEEVKEDR